MTASFKESEFDERRGFAAVEAFFKNGTDATTTPVGLQMTPPDINIKKSSRQGVGATSDGNPSTSLKLSHPQEQRILQIGSHRRRKRQGYGDEDDEEASCSKETNNDSESKDGDDEKGRTAIVKDRVKNYIISNDTASTRLAPQRKKKKGKKERKLQSTTALADNINPKTDETDRLFETTEAVLGTSKSIADDKLEATTEEAPNTQRKRRKKIRSKQKNIRKDHRDVKPVHVLEKGRPLTAETRAKLQAPKIIRSPLDHPE
jgi:ElaB/YqjD/DUF883 family membrane-anchored ribosome-binding protein